jgi:hypothetical protein
LHSGVRIHCTNETTERIKNKNGIEESEGPEAAVKHFNAIVRLHNKYPEDVQLVITDMSMIDLAAEVGRASGRKSVDFSK